MNVIVMFVTKSRQLAPKSQSHDIEVRRESCRPKEAYLDIFQLLSDMV
jgi:hypothetical protein